MAKKQYKITPTEVEVKNQGDGRTISGYASTFGGSPDSYDDIVSKGAFARTIRDQGPPKTRIKLLYLHHDPLGMPTVLREDDHGLYFEAKISNTQLGNDAIELVKDGVLDKMSIGFQIIEQRDRFVEEFNRDIRFLDEVKLFEISVVPFPANTSADIFGLKDAFKQNAMFVKSVAEFYGLEFDFDKKLLLPKDEKTVNTFGDLPLAGREDNWDSSTAIERVRQWADAEDAPNEQYRRAFFWYDETNEGLFSSYKLPFADIRNGEIVAVPRGIFAAAAALQGARGGVDIPESDVPALQNLIGRYYAKMRQEFDDDTIVAPWDEERQTPVVADEKLDDEVIEEPDDKPLDEGDPEPVASDENDTESEVEKALNDLYLTLKKYNQKSDDPEDSLQDGDDQPLQDEDGEEEKQLTSVLNELKHCNHILTKEN
jgi:HK97 family phage prohead protease